MVPGCLNPLRRNPGARIRCWRRASPGCLGGSARRAVVPGYPIARILSALMARMTRTWVRITAQGRAALAAELATLTELLRRHTASRGT